MRKKGKKEIIVKTVFTCIFIFMLWWAFIIWERFSSDVAVDQSIDEVGMVMLWYDIQNKRYIPSEATIEAFELQLDEQKDIVKYDFTVQGEKEGKLYNFRYTEQRDVDYAFEQTPVEVSTSNHLRATIFFRAMQLLQIKQLLVEETQVLFASEVEDGLSELEPSHIWKIDGESLTEIKEDMASAFGYEKCYLVSGDTVEWVYIKI